MNKLLHIIVATWLLAPGALRAQSAREEMKAGSKEFENGAFDKAAAHFEEAASLAAKQKLDPAVAHYNRGSALFKMQNFAEAGQAYQNALRTTDLDLAPDAYYNRGNTLTLQALQLEQQQLDQSIGLLDQALDMYEKSILLKPDNSSAKANYELVTIKKKQLIEQQQQQQQQNQDQDKEEQKEDQSQEQDKQEQDKQDQDNEDQQQQPQEEQSGQDEQQEQPQPRPSNEMTEEEAEMMLDAMKNDEKTQREQIQMLLGKPQPVDKDW